MLLQEERSRRKAPTSACFPRVSLEAGREGLRKIMAYLDGKSRGNCRLTCRAWKEVLDQEVGLYVTCNEKKHKKGNATFCRTVVIERLTVEHLDKFSKYVTLRCPERLLMVHCIGPVSPDWFKQKLLAQCSNLRRLEVSGCFLQSQELTCRIGNAGIDKRSNSKDDWGGNATTRLLTFPHLKALLIFYTEADVERYLHHVNGTGPLQSIWGSIFGTRFQAIYLLKQMIDANVSYILDTVRSPVLATLCVSVDAMAVEEKAHSAPTSMWAYKWKTEPLRLFLHAHRSSLRRLYLPAFNGARREATQLPSLFPTALQTLELTVLQKGDRHHTTYMEQLLLAQLHLRELRFEKDYVGQALTDFPALAPALRNSEKTLTFLHLTLSPPERNFLDGATFANCHVLKTLILHTHAPSHQLHFRNVRTLPHSLTHLSIQGPTLLLLPGEVIHCPRLDVLLLHRVAIHSSDDSTPSDMTPLLRRLLRMRRLSRLFIQTEDAEDEVGVVVARAMLAALLADNAYLAPHVFANLEMQDAEWALSYEPHFLESSPFGRLVVDPTSKRREDEQPHCPLERVIVRSNISHSLRLAGKEGWAEEGSWCEFCYALFTVD